MFFIVTKDGALEPFGLYRGKGRIEVEDWLIQRMFPLAADKYIEEKRKGKWWWCSWIIPISRIFEQIQGSERFETFCNLFELNSANVVLRFASETDQYDEEYAKFVFDRVLEERGKRR